MSEIQSKDQTYLLAARLATDAMPNFAEDCFGKRQAPRKPLICFGRRRQSPSLDETDRFDASMADTAITEPQPKSRA